MKVKTRVRAGRLAANHNQTRGIKVKSRVRAGKLAANHNQSRV
jgi:hypothetical protein